MRYIRYLKSVDTSGQENRAYKDMFLPTESTWNDISSQYLKVPLMYRYHFIILAYYETFGLILCDELPNVLHM